MGNLEYLGIKFGGRYKTAKASFYLMLVELQEQVCNNRDRKIDAKTGLGEHSLVHKVAHQIQVSHLLGLCHCLFEDIV